MAQYENKGDRQNILLADELPEDMTGTQDTQHICGKCAWYSFRKLESICRKMDKEVAYFATKECFTTDKDMDMEENNNAQPVAETGTQVCKECGRTLPLEDFQRRRNGNVDNVCKACRAEKARIGIARKKAVKEKPSVEDVLEKAGVKPYKDGNMWCILAGDNLQEGLCGFGDTIEDALCDFLIDVFNAQREQKSAEWSEDYREEDIQTRFAFYTYKDDPSVLYLSNVFVEESSRNHGFGTRILKAAEEVAKTIGAITISLKVKQDSLANAWYRKNGYGYVAFEDGYDWLEKNLEYMKPNHNSLPIEQQMDAIMIAIRGEVPSKKPHKQKSADDTAFEELIDDWWKHYKVNNPDSYDKGDEVQFDESGFKDFCRGIRNMFAEQKPEVITPVTYVANLSDGFLLEELRRRGYKGRISKCEEVEI